MASFGSKLARFALGRWKLADAHTKPVTQEATLPFIASSTTLFTPRLDGSIIVPFIGSTTTLYALALQQDIAVPRIASATVVYDLVVQGDELSVPFISSATVLYTPDVQSDSVRPGFISSATVLYELIVQGDFVELPFIPSTTVLYAPYVQPDFVECPFIASHTVVYRPNSVWTNQSGTGNGGELFDIQLAPTGTVSTVQLLSSLTSSATTMHFTSPISGLLSGYAFVVTIDDEVILVRALSLDGLTASSLVRGQANTTAAAHSGGANVDWDDKYDMAIVATSAIPKDFFFTVDNLIYKGFLVAFDSSQAYLGASRYPTHVSEMLGVFPDGTGSSGTNKCDGAQPSAVNIHTGTSDYCPAGLTNPARIVADIVEGDVALVRYENVEASVLVIGSRATAIQSWYGLSRRNESNVDVTDTDPGAHVVDGTAQAAEFEDDFLTATLPGNDRTYTYGPPRFSDKGWPIGVITVRQGVRRVPFWTSPNWHDFTYVYSGFGTDATFAQMVINRNDFNWDPASPDPTVDLPGPQDIDGPNATWDDTRSYYTSTVWLVGIYGAVGQFILVGPPIGGGPIVPPAPVPGVPPGGTTTGPPPSGGGGFVPPSTPPLEGGSGGGITPAPTTPVVGVFFDQKLVPTI